MSNKPNPLVAAWRSKVESQGILADGIRAMNDTLNTKYTNSRVNEWQDGRVKVPKAAAKYMLGMVLPEIIKRYNVSDQIADDMAQEIFNMIPE